MAETKLPKVKRRDFLRGTLLAGTAGGLAAFGAAALGQLWPTIGEGFGGQITIGNAEEIVSQINADAAPLVVPEGRMYVVTWNPSVPGAMEAYGEDHLQLDDTTGLMALYHKCVHLGCRVPWCQSSQWFECPCHGSKYNRWGEWTDGPAPRGLDRFGSEIDDSGQMVVNTAVPLTGPARSARVLAQQPEGAHCIDI